MSDETAPAIAGVAEGRELRYCAAKMACSLNKPKRINDPAFTRARILDAAAPALPSPRLCEDLDAGLIDAASVTSGALHHHYPTKKELGLAVIRERVAPVVEEAWIEPVLDAADAFEGITNAFEGIAGGLRRRRIAGCPLNNLAVELAFAEPEFRKAIDILPGSGSMSSRRRSRAAQSAPPACLQTSSQPSLSLLFRCDDPREILAIADPLKVALKCLATQWPKQKAA